MSENLKMFLWIAGVSLGVSVIVAAFLPGAWVTGLGILAGVVTYIVRVSR